jgi:hypothetical protein
VLAVRADAVLTTGAVVVRLQGGEDELGGLRNNDSLRHDDGCRQKDNQQAHTAST